MTEYPDLFAALAAPFGPGEVKTRDAGGGRRVDYVTARTVANRLDSVLGPENWWDAYPVVGESSAVCALTLRLPDGREVTKHDAGGAAGMADAGDDDKSMFSDAFKRAAQCWGVARYLYRDGVPSFAQNAPRTAVEPPPAVEPIRRNGHAGGHAGGHAKPRHDWPGKGPGSAAVPAAAVAPPPVETHAPDNRRRASVPATGKALFAWVREQETRLGVGLLKYIQSWSKLQDFPGRMVDWSADEVAAAHAEACRKLSSIDLEREPGSDG